MAPQNEDDWSDSDDEVGSDVETAVQLGIPDGRIDAPADLLDATVSRIGGHPAFLRAPPPLESATCKNCHQPMQLLVQVWCPLENSPNDRAIYVWGCARGACQKKEGSVCAWRGLRYNQKYAEKLARRREKEKAQEEEKARAAEEEAARQSAPKTNPFSMKAMPAAASNPFALGDQIFGAAPLAPVQPQDSAKHQDELEASSDGDRDDDSSEDEGANELADRLASATLDDSLEWSKAPAYDPMYLSTVAEYLPPARKMKIPAGAEIVEDDEDKKGKDGGWTLEGYENSIEVDHVFERFTKRVGYEGEQCLRYELGGTPLPFARDSIFDKLFPTPPAPPLPVTKADFMVTPPQRRTYDPSSLPPCPHCRAPRVFECQLMPNLINVLRAPAEGPRKPLSDEERRQEVMRALRGERAAERVGMEWGTCMVFSCEKDCADPDTRGGWHEELVLVQWDD
ncbi:hypothetical protein WOLCODRAFT_123482 [Wolfiporia cocos MD-104 SS10]|uniref:Programmed cell death protein 2 C-terminal domain-containing protein n=1 Tax=Wolfiporia cocos (strain MD-104) TaxID=742152 RepID=A0A2H3K7H3_WOLCO|nr:hypothetical protein WOLCODRAFT_123482 [Wolfiporia cocos MD-104 SS10]